MRKKSLEALKLDFYKMGYLDFLDDEECKSLEKWIDSEEPDDDRREIMFYTVLEKSIFKRLLEKEDLIPYGMEHIIEKFLVDLANEDPLVMNWYHKYVTDMLKKQVTQEKANEKNKKILVKQIMEIEKNYLDKHHKYALNQLLKNARLHELIDYHSAISSDK